MSEAELNFNWMLRQMQDLHLESLRADQEKELRRREEWERREREARQQRERELEVSEAELNFNRMLKQMQDQKYLESLRDDQEKELRRREEWERREREARQQRERELEEQRRREQIQRQKIEY
jgi:hypothetical protein